MLDSATREVQWVFGPSHDKWFGHSDPPSQREHDPTAALSQVVPTKPPTEGELAALKSASTLKLEDLRGSSCLGRISPEREGAMATSLRTAKRTLSGLFRDSRLNL